MYLYKECYSDQVVRCCIDDFRSIKTHSSCFKDNLYSFFN